MISVISSVLAMNGPSSVSWAIFGATIAAGVIIVGAAIGVAIIGGKAVESIARQPEAGGRIFMSMIIAAALIEGVTFFALLICFLAVFWLH
ncbi:MAG: ATP synthase F0 subunit C [Phycisphaerae bacterium]|nr:ATP synthase F0 subunit C [Phycisphaerae bacterium]HON93536.1 ATP synthase F0 subunit C [Sedimentisphaerales bacterium]